jgi:hypothetical protein
MPCSARNLSVELYCLLSVCNEVGRFRRDVVYHVPNSVYPVCQCGLPRPERQLPRCRTGLATSGKVVYHVLNPSYSPLCNVVNHVLSLFFCFFEQKNLQNQGLWRFVALMVITLCTLNWFYIWFTSGKFSPGGSFNYAINSSNMHALMISPLMLSSIVITSACNKLYSKISNNK